ncbi:type VII secretion protein EccE [Rhodococcus sp. NPDC003318]|uniref:type VII secretion protein EccE n=1 Tax=Rhodococcus sp. NPDC003318 TaxID=3364503 RepID=UPI00367ADE9D
MIRRRSRHLWPATAVHTLVTAQGVAVAVAALACTAGLAWWQVAIPAVAVAALCLLPVRGRCLLDWTATLIGYLSNGTGDAGQSTDAPTPDGSVIGLRWEAGTVSTVIELLPDSGTTRLGRDRVDGDHRVPLRELAESLRRHDIALAGIDVVAHGSRVDPGTAAGEVYRDLIGPLPAVARRTVWLAIRFDAASETEAVARRGGGRAGAARAVSVATQRIVNSLTVSGVRGRILSATDIDSVAAVIAGDPEHDTGARSWTHAPVHGGCNTGYSVDPRLLDAGMLAAVWSARSDATTVTVRLRPGPTSREVRVAASCRFNSAALPSRPDVPGLVPTIGRDRAALRSHLPGAPPKLDALTDFTTVEPGWLDATVVPAGGCGQLIGADAEGRAVAVRLAGDVEVVGELYLAQQLVFRAVATGARVVVHSSRPHVWRSLVDAVAAPERLRVADREGWSGYGVTTIVVDGTDTLRPDPSVTVIRLLASPADLSPTASATVVQPGARGNRIILWANRIRSELTLVTTPGETAYLGRPHASVRVPSGQPG